MVDQLWILLSSLFVLTLVFGLSFLYGGISRANHSISSMLQPILIIPVLTFFWYLGGFNLVFSSNNSAFIGEFRPILSSIAQTATINGLPLSLFSFFQLMFALVACSVVVGSNLERSSFKFNIIFSVFWLLLVYCPVARWVWSDNGWLKQLGSLDYAGGLVVHITSGFTGLLLANLVGRRLEYFKLRKKHSNALALLGLFFIWIGWFGFNGGSALTFGNVAIISIVATFIASCSSLFIWLAVDMIHTPHKFSISSYSLGVVSGLVAITPCAAYVSFSSAIIIGLIAGFSCNYCTRIMHKVFKVDDSTEVFSTHGFGGVIGAVLTGVFAEASLVGTGIDLNHLLYANLISSLVVGVYTLTVTLLIFKLLSIFVSPRVLAKVEHEGLDLVEHGEKITNF